MSETTLYPFQIAGVRLIEERFQGRCLIADDMGCIDGDAILTINRGGKSSKFKLSDVYKGFHSLGGRSWNRSIPTMTRSLIDGQIRLNEIKDIIFKGMKSVLKIKLEDGKELKLTYDHEVLRRDGEWIPIRDIHVKEKIMVNGTPSCPMCGSTKGIVTYAYAKFIGFCRKCVYQRKKKQTTKEGKYIDNDGYIRVSGQFNHPRSTKGHVYEHILVMEQKIERFVKYPEEHVHHKNGNRSDNRIENLELLLAIEHQRRYGDHTRLENDFRGTVIFTPKPKKVISIEKYGMTEVYDVIMKDPGRNFVANGILVHNCGKTIQAITYAENHPELRPVIIIVPATIKIKWQREIKQHIEMDSHIINGSDAPPTCPVFEHDLIIINYDILIRKKARGSKKKKNQPNWLDHLKKLKPQLVIIDEGQNISNPKAIRTKAVRNLCVGVPKVLILTGTPVENKPADIFTCVNILRPDVHEFSNAFRFYEKFCALKKGIWGWEWNGATNLTELNRLLKKHVMIRRKKEEVLSQLPEKTRVVIPLEIDREIYDTAATDFVTWLQKGRTPEDYKVTEFSKISYLKQLVGKLKYDQMTEWLDDWLKAGDGKIIVVTVHRKMMRLLVDKYGSLCVFIDGSRTGQKRQDAIDQFQNNPKVRIMFGQLVAAGTGWDGPMASAIAFFEIGWNPAKHDQMESRGHRLTSKNNLTCYYLVGHETIEMSILQINEKKQKIIDQAIDGKSKSEQSISVREQVIQILKKKYGGKK